MNHAEGVRDIRLKEKVMRTRHSELSHLFSEPGDPIGGSDAMLSGAQKPSCSILVRGHNHAGEQLPPH
eukprot:6422944-Amphidinium_carterae.1